MELQSTEIKELATALSKVQGELKPAVKSADNPFFKSKYADLSAVVDACKEALAKHGFSYVQAIQGDSLVTTLLHSSGQWMRSIAAIKPVKADPQSFGSAVTYMRRYSLAALVGVCTEDDDGNAASDAKKKPDLSMEYDPESNKQAYEQALKTIAGMDTVEKIETYFKTNKNKLNKLPKDYFEDIIQACANQKSSINNNLNGAAH